MPAQLLCCNACINLLQGPASLDRDTEEEEVEVKGPAKEVCRLWLSMVLQVTVLARLAKPASGPTEPQVMPLPPLLCLTAPPSLPWATPAAGQSRVP